MKWPFVIVRLLQSAALITGVCQLPMLRAECHSGLGLCDCIHHSDHCFDDFISPTSNPVWFEDPRTLTEARALYVEHDLTDQVGGGDVQLYALQLRLALTERLSLVASKDGFMVSNSQLLDDGWMDVAAGLKYNLLRDTRNGHLLSVGLGYAIPIGSQRTLQDNGDGEFHLYLTGGRRLGGLGHWLSCYGAKIPVDQDAQSTFAYWSNHFDVMLSRKVYLLTEFNWFHWLDEGSGGVNDIEGLDVINLGSTGVDGNQILTQAVGLKYKPTRYFELGGAYEFPLSDRRDIIDDRLTIDAIFRY